MFKKVNAARDFSGYLAKLTSLDRTFFQDVIDSIPLEWKVTDLERAALVDFLWERAQAIPDYMTKRLKKEVWW